MKAHSMLLAQVILGLSAAAAGCGVDAGPVDGVEVLSTDDHSLTGVVNRDGVVLRFMTQAGTGDGSVGAVARFLDEQDRTIAVGFFGHDMPPAWIASLPDVDIDDPARLALATATADFDELTVPTELNSHVRALALTAQTVPAILDLESRADSDPEANVAAMDALAPELQAGIADFYNVLAPEPVVRRAYTLTDAVVVSQEAKPRGTACNSFDVNYRQSTLLGFTAFRFHQYRSWCWDTNTHRMYGAGSRGSYATSVNSAFVYKGWWVNQDYWLSYPFQHVYNTQGHFQNCVVKYGCIGSYYPWIKSWVDGWGSWTHRKGG